MDERNERLRREEAEGEEERGSKPDRALLFQWPREIRMRKTHRVSH